jgi:hypothetical protein
MAKVSPFHTDFDEHPVENREVYHDHDDCPDGGMLLPHHRISGTGGKRPCKKCTELGREDPVVTGTRPSRQVD